MEAARLVHLVKADIRRNAKRVRTNELLEDVESELKVFLLEQLPRFKHKPELDCIKIAKRILRNRAIDIGRFYNRRPHFSQDFLGSFDYEDFEGCVSKNPKFGNNWSILTADNTFSEEASCTVFKQNLLKSAKAFGPEIEKLVQEALNPSELLLKTHKAQYKRETVEIELEFIRKFLKVDKSLFEDFKSFLTTTKRYSLAEA